MATHEIRDTMADPAQSLAHYRVRAYRDALIIITLAAATYFILMRFDFANLLVTRIYEARSWELADLFAVSWLLLAASFVFVLRRRAELIDEIRQRERLELKQTQLIFQLEDALASVRTLTGLLPICASCKKIRDDRGYWSQVETYLQTHTDATFTHGICPDCAATMLKST